jgi:hypothetical protein
LNLERTALNAYMLSEGGTHLYDAARQLSDQNVGHASGCEWHTNGNAYCSCGIWEAACAGVDAALEALVGEEEAPATAG